MSIYSQMTDSRSPGKMKFMEGDDDFWEWRQGSRGTPGTLQQFIPDGRGGFVEGNELDLVSFNKASSTLTTIETADKDVSGVYETNLRTGKRKLLYRNKINNISYAHVDEEGVVYGARFLEGGYPASVFFKVP